MNFLSENKNILKKIIVFFIFVLLIGSILSIPTSTKAQTENDIDLSQSDIFNVTSDDLSEVNETLYGVDPNEGTSFSRQMDDFDYEEHDRTWDDSPAGQRTAAALKRTEDNEGNIFTRAVKNGLMWAITQLGNFQLKISGWFLWMSGVMLNMIVFFSIENMSTMISNSFIRDTWSVLRDLVNILFIFGLLYISIRTILQSWNSSTRILLRNLIIAGLLINFSFFFTSVLIDASNLVTVKIYDSMGECKGETHVNDYDRGISDCWVNALKITTVYDVRGNTGGDPSSSILHDVSSGANQADGLFKILQATLLGSFFIFLTALVLGALAISLLVRFIILVFLLITSPVMFLGMILPNLSGVTKKWVSSLQSNLLYAPLAFLFMWISYKITVSSDLLNTATVGSGAGIGGWAQAFVGDGIQVVINYMIIIGFLVASIIIAKSVGGNITARSMKLGASLTAGAGAKLGQNTVGRFANWRAKNITGTDKASIARRAVYKKIGDSSFDGRRSKAFKGIASATGIDLGEGKKGGYRTSEEAGIKRFKETYKSVGNPTQNEQIKIDNLRQELKKKYSSDVQASKDGKKEIKRLEQQKKGMSKKNEDGTENKDYTRVENMIRAEYKSINEIKGRIERDPLSKKIKETAEAGKSRQQEYLDNISGTNKLFSAFTGSRQARQAARSIRQDKAKKENESEIDKMVGGLSKKINKDSA